MRIRLNKHAERYNSGIRWMADGTSRTGEFRASRPAPGGGKEYLYGDEARRAVGQQPLHISAPVAKPKEQKPPGIPKIPVAHDGLKRINPPKIPAIKGQKAPKKPGLIQRAITSLKQLVSGKKQLDPPEEMKARFEDVANVRLPDADQFAKLAKTFKPLKQQGMSGKVFEAEHEGQKLIAKKVTNPQDLGNEVAVVRVQKLLGLRDVHSIAAYHVQGDGDYVVMPNLPGEDQPFVNMRMGPKVMASIPPDRIGELGFANWLTNAADRNVNNYIARDGHIHAIDYTLSFQAHSPEHASHWDQTGKPVRRDDLLAKSGKRLDELPVPRRVLENAIRNRKEIEDEVPKYVNKASMSKRFDKIESVLRNHDQPNLSHFIDDDVDFDHEQTNQAQPQAKPIRKFSHAEMLKLAQDRVGKIQEDLAGLHKHVDSAVQEIRSAPQAKKVGDGAIGDRVAQYDRGKAAVSALRKIPHEKIAKHKEDVKKISDWAMSANLSKEQGDQIAEVLDKANKSINSWHEEANTKIRKAFSTGGPSGISGTLGFESDKDKSLLENKTHETAMAFKTVASWVKDGPKERVHISMADGRACYNRATKQANANDGRSASHEVGHHIEIYAPGAYEAAKAYLEHRVGGETPTRIFKGLDEYGRSDKFKWVGTGDRISALYAGKASKSGTTEILSMGVEGLWKDPIAFAKNDPEWFAFTLGVLDGSLRVGNKTFNEVAK